MNALAQADETGPTLDDLRRRVGGDAVEEGSAVWRFAAAGVAPRCVVRPGNVAEVAEVVRVVANAGGALVPAGNATHLDVGAPPRRYDCALSTARINKILAHDAADMTVTVEAGTTLASLNETLAGASQWLPLDPPRASEMTVGGLIAGDRNGPLRLAYGKVRDLLIGVAVVTADGSVVRGGGRVVKNVAGYDLPKLFAGSFGTLGVIVEATFKVLPRPAEVRLCVWPLDSTAEALRRALALLDEPVHPCLLEVLNEAAAESVGIGSGAGLIIGFAGSAAEVDVEEARLSAIAAVTRCEPARAEALHRAIRDFPVAANDDALVARVSARPSELARLLERLELEAAARRLVVEIAAHAGSGVAWCQVLGANDPPMLAWFAQWLRVQAEQCRAWVVFEYVPAALRATVDPWGFGGAALPLMAGVKRALDPGAVFSPGRFVGGI